jgi:hypothetical protein
VYRMNRKLILTIAPAVAIIIGLAVVFDVI